MSCEHPPKTWFILARLVWGGFTKQILTCVDHFLTLLFWFRLWQGNPPTRLFGDTFWLMSNIGKAGKSNRGEIAHRNRIAWKQTLSCMSLKQIYFDRYQPVHLFVIVSLEYSLTTGIFITILKALIQRSFDFTDTMLLFVAQTCAWKIGSSSSRDVRLHFGCN